jgi:bifunctional UDP-N-acetylglucosamine pyrophosphorylase/glucosamine-1-phosphate N-acetyltransferase
LVVLRLSRSDRLSLTVVVLADGWDGWDGAGGRLQSARPPALYPLAGQPLISFVLDLARALDPACLAVSAPQGEAQIQQAVGDEVACVALPAGGSPGQALLAAKPMAAGLGDTVLVLPGDNPLVHIDTLRDLVARHQSAAAAVTLLAAATYPPTEDTLAGGWATAPGTPSAEGEAKSGPACFRDRWLWSNLADLARSGRAGSLVELASRARAQGQPVERLAPRHPLETMAVTDRLNLTLAETEMQRRLTHSWMCAGVSFVLPHTSYVEAGVEIGPDTVVWPNTLLQGQTRIGRSCTLGPGSVIRDSTIGDRCRVELSVVERAIMDEDSDIGPFGHLRKGAHLGAGAHMGNFGEVKNSYLGPGAKMGHMSYLGDATVGAGANIGAGTITCNYDGHQKHPTIIGAGAFIGSDTMLVAPVEIGEGAQTGAGAVVTGDVPPGRLAYGVPARLKPVRRRQESEE